MKLTVTMITTKMTEKQHSTGVWRNNKVYNHAGAIDEILFSQW